MTGGNRIVARLLLILGSLLLTCLLLEVALRVSGYHPFRDLLNGRELILRPSPIKQRVYEATPGAQGHAWDTDIRINRHGFRDRDYPLEKADGVYRIIVLGDSITFGNALPADDTFPKQLEEMYRADDRKVEVLNLGLGGYNTLQEVGMLEHIGVPFAPDLVVVGYCINDIGDNSPNLDYIQAVRRYGSSVYRLRLVQWIRARFDRALVSRQMVERNEAEVFAANNKDYIVEVEGDLTLSRYRNQLWLKLQSIETQQDLDYFVPMYLGQPYLGKLRYSLEALRKLQREHGFQVVVAVLPVMTTAHREVYAAVYRIIEHEASRLGFDILDLYGAFESAGFEGLRLWDWDPIHPNELGHRLVAAELYKHIRPGGG